MVVKYILHSRQDKKASWVVPFWKYPRRYKLAYQDDLYEIYENMNAYDRAFIVHNYKVIPDGRDMISVLYLQNTDLRKIVLLESDPGIALSDCHDDVRS